jgi:GTP cyclohydrolase II
VVDSEVDHAPDAEPAGVAAVAAIQLAKLAQSLPAVLATQANRAGTAIFDPPLVKIEASAVQHYRKDIVRSLKVVGEAHIPLSTGTQTRFVAFRDALGENSVSDHRRRSGPYETGARAAAFGLLDRRRVRLATMRLWRSVEIVACTPRRNRRRHNPLSRSGRPRARPRQQMRTYQLQEAGLDTVDANTALGFDDDERDYGVAARMLEMLGIQRIVLLTNNPTKLDGLAKSGIEITGCLPVEAPVNSDNARYLAAKAARAGHQLGHLIGSLAEVSNAAGCAVENSEEWHRRTSLA